MGISLTILIYGAEIEAVPRELWQEPAIRNDSKRRRRHPGKILLYTPVHHDAMVRHGIDVYRRGRPDITQDILKTICNHPFTRENRVSIYLYTVEGRTIWVNPETRIPHDYYRFEGLMIQLLEKGMVPPDDGRFMKIVYTPLGEILGDKVFILHEEGEEMPPDKEYYDGSTLVIGGFQKGDFDPEILGRGRKISIYREPLYASTAMCIFLTRIL